MSMPNFGDRVRTQQGATGRYLGDGLALYVSAQDNELAIAEADLGGGQPNMLLPVPGDEACEAALVGIRHGEATTARRSGDV